MSTLIVTEKWQPQPITNLVESIPVKKGKKLSELSTVNNHFHWEDLQGASWLFNEDWS